MTEYKRVFLDTNPIIYYLQHNAEFGDTVKEFLIATRKEKAQFVSSDVTIEEYCVYPYREKNTALIDSFERFVSLSEMEIVHTSEAIAKKAAQIREEFTAFKTMDSLQLATAIISGCDYFLTNDKQLQQFTEIKVQLVRDLGASSTE